MPACSWWPVMAVVPFSRMMKVMSWPALMALEMAIWPEWKKVPSPMKTSCFVGDERVDAAAGAGAEAHARVVVHELLGGGGT